MRARADSGYSSSVEHNKQKHGDEESQPAGDDSDDALSQAAQEEADAALEPLGEGSTFSLGFAVLPVRALVAMAIFVVVFMVAWMILWAVGGGMGLGLGWILAAVAGALAVKLYSDRLQ